MPAAEEFFSYTHQNLGAVQVQPEGLTVENSWVLDLYTLFHARDYKAFRVVLPENEKQENIAHLLIPPGEGPHPAVVAFEILDGPQDVSEGMAKALVNRGYAVARLERRALGLDKQSDPAVVRDTIRDGVRDGRRLLDWLVTHPKIDKNRIAAAGVSLGSIQALLLTACDPRIRGGFFVMTGGGLPETFWDSSELAVQRFRDRLMEARGWSTREQFVEGIRPYTEPVDPLTYAGSIAAPSVMLASGRFDTVMPSESTQRLFEALGEPLWYKLPCGHYTLFPFFWWTLARGADHLDRLFAPNPPS
jgi:dienelactone hydrolase